MVTYPIRLIFTDCIREYSTHPSLNYAKHAEHIMIYYSRSPNRCVKGIRLLKHEAIHSPNLVPKLRMHGAIPQLA